MTFWEKIGAFFASIADGTLNFYVIGDFFNGYIARFQASEELMNMWNGLLGFLSKLGAALPIVLLALCAVEIFLGKKLIQIQRFLACVAVGYCVGVLSISPLINQAFLLPNYISGIVIAVVAAVLSKYIYFVALALAAGYSVFLICYTNACIPFPIPTAGNLVVSIIVAAVIVLLMFLLLKYVEMAGTAILGGYLATRVVIANYFDYRTWSFLVGREWIGEIVFVGIIAIIGFIVQYKSRARY
jgi:hypothetical protein